ncbi:MAG: hypothetical protein AB2598_07690 [Candidatus Thiodiazotropha sp.]
MPASATIAFPDIRQQSIDRIMETQHKYALLLFVMVIVFSRLRYGFDEALVHTVVLAAFLVPLLFYRIVAFFSGFGFPEYFARDFKSENRPGPYALFFWILYLIACAFIVFDWSIY